MSLAAPYQEHYYVADGSTTSFAFGQSFTALNEIDVKCIIYFEDGTNCVPVFNVNMTTGFINIVSLTKPDGTLLTVPPAGSIVRVFRKTPEAQNVTASQLQNYTAKQLERVFDSLVAMIQEISYSDIHKTVRLTETQRDIAIDYLPDDKDQAVIYWNVEERKLMPADFGQNQVVKSDGVEWLVYNQSEGKVYFIPRQGGNPIPIGRATIHNDLSGRNAPDCHPESAITGLREHLQELRDKDIEIEEDIQIALNHSQEAKDTADEAKETAEYAQTVAGEAKDIAEEAKETAEGIEDIAQEAKDTADEAKEIAQDAKDIAEGVEDIAQEALDKVTQEITDREDADEDLQDQIDSLSGRGRFLTLWNCATGLAESNPPESPYPYKAGDYFVVGTVSSADPAVNYKPDGSSYTTGVASTTVETNEVSVNDTYFYDGTVWKLQSNAQKEVSFSALAGSPYDNTNLSNALNAKQDALVSGTNIKTINNESLLGAGNFSLSEQLAVLPEPTSTDDGRIVQYVGETVRVKHDLVTFKNTENSASYIFGFMTNRDSAKQFITDVNAELGIDCVKIKFVLVSKTSGMQYDVYLYDADGTEHLYAQSVYASNYHGFAVQYVSGNTPVIGDYVVFECVFDDVWYYNGCFYKCYSSVALGEKPTGFTLTITNQATLENKFTEAETTLGVNVAKIKVAISGTSPTTFNVYAVDTDNNEHLILENATESDTETALGISIVQTGSWTVGLYFTYDKMYYWGLITELNHLADIKITNPQNGQALVYDTDSKKWVNGNGGLSATYEAATETITFA